MKEATEKNTGNKKELRDIFDNVQYTIFGLDDINKQLDTIDTDMPELESEESADKEEKQKDKDLKY